jgi:hypothetical protein
MKDLVESLAKVIPLLDDYPLWVRGVVGGWLFVTAAVAVVLLLVPREAKTAPGARAATLWLTTGDRDIDRVHDALNSLEAGSHPINEQRLRVTLKSLFYRPAYSHVLEESEDTFLFALRRTQLILQYYTPSFSSSPSTRQNLVFATTRLVKLQQQLARVYGPTFDVDRFARDHEAKRTDFVDSLPPIERSLRDDPTLVSEATNTLEELVSALGRSGLTDRPTEQTGGVEGANDTAQHQGRILTTGTRRTSQVFISYRHVEPDERLADALAAYLLDRGITVFQDKRVRIGRSWIKEIDRHLRASTAFVVFVSAKSILSDMVRQEVVVAHERWQAGELSVLPIRVDFQGELPYDLAALLNPIQYGVWRQGDPIEEICREIHAALTEDEPLPIDPPMEDTTDAVLTGPATSAEQEGAPLPAADPRIVHETGIIRLESPFYVRRAEDDFVQRSLSVKATTIIIKGPRQSGKSSLLARAFAFAKSTALPAVYVDFQTLDSAQFAGLTTLLQALASKIARTLKTPLKPADTWDSAVGAKDNFAYFLEMAVLAAADHPVVLLLDEVDRVFDQDYRGDFFSAVRAWHGMRATAPQWENLNLIIAHATDPTLWIPDLNQSPFNVGESRRLADFNPDQIWHLNRLHGSPIRDKSGLAALTGLVGGHPYLVRQALYSLTSNSWSLIDLQRVACDNYGPFGDHLRRHLWALGHGKRLSKAVIRVIRDGVCDEEEVFQGLVAAGLVVGDSRHTARMRCELYRDYFPKHL